MLSLQPITVRIPLHPSFRINLSISDAEPIRWRLLVSSCLTGCGSPCSHKMVGFLPNVSCFVLGSDNRLSVPCLCMMTNYYRSSMQERRAAKSGCKRLLRVTTHAWLPQFTSNGILSVLACTLEGMPPRYALLILPLAELCAA